MIKRIDIKNYQNYIIIFIFVHFAFFFLKLGKNKQFNALISFYSSLSIIMSVYSLYSQINQTKLNRISNDVVYVNKIFSEIDDDIYSFFFNNKKMNYYYYELYNGTSDYKEEDRDLNLEKLITFKILSNAETLINYIDALKTTNAMINELNIAEEKLKRLLKMFIKSKIFVQNWKEYSKSIAMNWTKDYFDLYFEYY